MKMIIVESGTHSIYMLFKCIYAYSKKYHFGYAHRTMIPKSKDYLRDQIKRKSL